VKFIHRFYTSDSPTPCVACYDLVSAAKLVIDPVRHMVWSYWHVDLYATPLSRSLPSLRTMSADEQPTASVSTADKWLHDCRHCFAMLQAELLIKFLQLLIQLPSIITAPHCILRGVSVPESTTYLLPDLVICIRC